MDIVEILLSHGADKNATDAQGKTPLLYSIVSHSEPCFIKLLNAGADISKDAPNGNSYLHEVCAIGFTK